VKEETSRLVSPKMLIVVITPVRRRAKYFDRIIVGYFLECTKTV
jgi:hypothetical protein